MVLADRVQERVELPDLVAVALAAGELGVQVGQVALQHDPVHLGERADADALAEHREPGQGAQPAAGGLQSEPGAEPPAQPPLHQTAQPRLPDRGEVESLVAGEPEAAQLPDVAVELALPAVAVGEVGRPCGGRRSAARAGSSRAAPDARSAIRQSCSVRSSSDTASVAARARTTAMTTAGRVLVARCVVAALQHVLDLQTQLRAQQVQPDDLLGGDRDRLEPADEHLDRRVAR